MLSCLICARSVMHCREFIAGPQACCNPFCAEGQFRVGHVFRDQYKALGQGDSALQNHRKLTEEDNQILLGDGEFGWGRLFASGPVGCAAEAETNA